MLVRRFRTISRRRSDVEAAGAPHTRHIGISNFAVEPTRPTSDSKNGRLLDFIEDFHWPLGPFRVRLCFPTRNSVVDLVVSLEDNREIVVTVKTR